MKKHFKLTWHSGLNSRFLFCLIFWFYLMYRLICQKPAHFLSAQMALVSIFFQMFIVLGMYNFGLTPCTRIVVWKEEPVVSCTMLKFEIDWRKIPWTDWKKKTPGTCSHSWRILCSLFICLCYSDRPKQCLFYCSVQTKQNKSINVLFPQPKPNLAEHVKTA